MEHMVETETIELILKLYGFEAHVTDQKSYIYAIEENGWMKLIFRISRPWIKDPNFTIVEDARAAADGYSFPSGHSANVGAVFGSIIGYLKKRWVTAVSVTICVVGGISGGWKLVNDMKDSERWMELAEQYGEGFWISDWYFRWDDIDDEPGNRKEDESGLRAESITEGESLTDVDIEKVQDLEIKIGGAALYILEAEDGKLSFQVEGKGKYRCYESGGVLVVEGGRDRKFSNNDEKVYLYLPKDKTFGDVSIDVGAGYIEIGAMTAEELAFSIGAGEITAESIKGDNLKVSAGAGIAQLENVNIREMDIEVGMGECCVQGYIQEEIKVECGMGNVELALTNEKEDFNYDISCAAGVIDIGGKSYSAMADDIYVDNDASGECTLECAMGNIEIAFE